MRLLIVLVLLLPLTVCGEDKETNKLLRDASNFINQQLPMFIDEETKLVSTVALLDTLIYKNMLVNFEKNEIDIKFFNDIISSNLLNGFCSSPDTKFYRDNKFKWKHVYYDKHNVYITHIVTDPAKCKP